MSSTSVAEELNNTDISRFATWADLRDVADILKDDMRTALTTFGNAVHAQIEARFAEVSNVMCKRGSLGVGSECCEAVLLHQCEATTARSVQEEASTGSNRTKKRKMRRQKAKMKFKYSRSQLLYCKPTRDIDDISCYYGFAHSWEPYAQQWEVDPRCHFVASDEEAWQSTYAAAPVVRAALRPDAQEFRPSALPADVDIAHPSVEKLDSLSGGRWFPLPYLSKASIPVLRAVSKTHCLFVNEVVAEHMGPVSFVERAETLSNTSLAGEETDELVSPLPFLTMIDFARTACVSTAHLALTDLLFNVDSMDADLNFVL
eukprot:TRINITY_DN11261_c0_g1_i4.p1 TRINITY_DN11261_c0_g1~~TRINITY_DN11261_c0_g1_i4.p1  ORF type:complete len:317 (+),score=38.90 TRINITY_DN11261_c0_g1_i4:145-1095(+)